MARATISLDIAPDLATRAAPGQLQQVMMNLLQNAFDALSTVPEPMVWVDMGCDGDPDRPERDTEEKPRDYAD